MTGCENWAIIENPPFPKEIAVPNLTKFRRDAAPQPKDAYVTLQKDRNFYMNRVAYAALGEPLHVALFFDPDERIIGFQATTADDPDAYRVLKYPSTTSLIISGARFSTFWGIQLEQTMRCPAIIVDGILTIDLKEAIEIPIREKRHRRQAYRQQKNP